MKDYHNEPEVNAVLDFDLAHRRCINIDSRSFRRRMFEDYDRTFRIYICCCGAIRSAAVISCAFVTIVP